MDSELRAVSVLTSEEEDDAGDEEEGDGSGDEDRDGSGDEDRDGSGEEEAESEWDRSSRAITSGVRVWFPNWST